MTGISPENKLFRFTRDLIEIDSTSGREGEAARFVAGFLQREPGWAGEFEVALWEVEAGRFNVFARRGHPEVVLSTHLDTVPPYFPSSEDDEFLHGRGACDAKGILAAQVFAAADLLRSGTGDFGLLFVVGEERNSAGAQAANLRPQGSRFLVNGEPTESKMIRAVKGALRLDLRAQGRAAHSAYPELGESAIDKLLAALSRLQRLPLPHDPVLGASTMNIGTLAGGRAPNVIADIARAEILIRLVQDGSPLRRLLHDTVGELAQAEFILEIPPIHLRTLPDFPTGVVAYSTDIPKLDAWGEPLLYGPGSIRVAHTAEERIAKRELADAVSGYVRIVTQLKQVASKLN